MKKWFICLVSSICTLEMHAQNVAINNDGSLPTIGAMLDVKSSSKGVLIPRVSLTGTNDILTIPNRVESLLIYNTATIGGANSVSPGYYYWDGTNWIRLTTNTSSLLSGWLLGGNAGTMPSTHFIGTTDNNSLIFKVNNRKAGYIGKEANDGNLFWGYESGYSNSIGLGNTAFGTRSLYSNDAGSNNVAVGIAALYNSYNGSNLVAIGDSALFNNIGGGVSNTAVGSKSLYANTTGRYNTAIGYNCLNKNTTGQWNTAQGSNALFSNTTGEINTAFGTNALSLNSTGWGNTGVGYGALMVNSTGSGNTAGGAFALQNTTGSYNTAFGHHALITNTTGGSNVAVGRYALFRNTTTSDQVAVGDSALFDNTTGYYNVGVGARSLSQNTTGAHNTATGYETLYSNVDGFYNTGIGFMSLYSNTSGIQNTALGMNTLYNNTTGNANSATGIASLYNNTTGINNTANGIIALYTNTIGSNNTAVGQQSLVANFSGNSNTSVGSYALQSNSTGNKNSAVGESSLYSNSTGSLNAALGFQAHAGNFSNATAVGSHAQVDCSNCLVLGSVNGINGASSNVNVGVGTTSPAARLDVAGGNWDLTGTEGDMRVGNNFYRIKFGIATGGGGAGDASIMQYGQPSGYNVLSLGSQGNKIIYVVGGTSRVGIGTDNPTEKLEVIGSVRANSFLTPSDTRLKRNVISIENGLEKILQLNGYNYYWSDESQDPSLQSGLLAQEVQKVIPGLVKVDERGMLSVNYPGLIPFLIQSIKEQNERINQLSKENEELKILKKEIEELKRRMERISGK